jgi:hypothetical protein
VRTAAIMRSSVSTAERGSIVVAGIVPILASSSKSRTDPDHLVAVPGELEGAQQGPNRILLPRPGILDQAVAVDERASQGVYRGGSVDFCVPDEQMLEAGRAIPLVGDHGNLEEVRDLVNQER